MGQGVSHGKAAGKEGEPKQGAPGYMGLAQPQPAPKGAALGTIEMGRFPSRNQRRSLGEDTAPPVQLLPRRWLTLVLKIHHQQELLRPSAFSPDAQDVNRHL